MSFTLKYAEQEKDNVAGHLRRLLREQFKRNTLDVIVGVYTQGSGYDFAVRVFDVHNANGFDDGAIETFTREKLETLFPGSRPEIRTAAPQMGAQP